LPPRPCQVLLDNNSLIGSSCLELIVLLLIPTHFSSYTHWRQTKPPLSSGSYVLLFSISCR
jgi:hypothetical protein